MKKWREKLSRELLRPWIYMTFTRGLLALTAVLLADFFLSPAAGRSLKQAAFALAGMLFAVLAWIAWLRLNGVRLPRLLMLRVNPRKKPSRMVGGDMIDYVDQRPTLSFEDLEDEEKDLVILGADLVCAVVFLAVAVVIR